MAADSVGVERVFDYGRVEPLNWEQFRVFLWEAVDEVLLASPGRWDLVADFVKSRCVGSESLMGSDFERVFGNIVDSFPEAMNWRAGEGVGPRLWTKILYGVTQKIFYPPPVFMNLGFLDDLPEDAPLVLEADDEPYRYSINLYRRVLGVTDVKGKSVVEVGCGCGGGVSFVKRYLGASQVTGVDLLPRHIEVCKEVHDLAGVDFVVGDAEDLPFGEGLFDVLINVESSHSYGSVEVFFSEVARVLRIGGHFLFADLRPVNGEWGVERNMDAVVSQLNKCCGFKVLSQVDVTGGVLQAMDRLNSLKVEMLRGAGSGNSDLSHFTEIMLCEGSANYRKLKSGDWKYFAFCIERV